MSKLPKLFLLPLFLLALLSAEENPEPKPILNTGDVQKFINTFPKIAEAYEKLGNQIKSRKDFNKVAAMASNEKVQAILEKYGWDVETFGQKLVTIASGYATAEMEKQLSQLPAQQRAMYESMMGGQLQMPDIHPQDLQMIQANLPKLTQFFENLE